MTRCRFNSPLDTDSVQLCKENYETMCQYTQIFSSTNCAGLVFLNIIS